MPITFACMLICTLAIAGVPYFAGFFSKDEVIKAGVLRLLDSATFDGWALYAVIALALAAALTAFYMFRLIFLTFYGEYRGNLKEHRFSAQLAAEGVEGPDPNEHAEEPAAHGAHDDHGHAAHAHEHHAAHPHGHAHEQEHGHAKHAPKGAHAAHAEAHGGHGAHGERHAHEPHESPAVMTVALVVLALLGIFGGHFWLTDPLGILHAHSWFAQLVTPSSLYGPEIAAFVAPEHAGAAAEHAAHLEHSAHNYALILSSLVAALGIGLAIYLYLVRPGLPARVVATLGQVYTAVRRKYCIDEAVDWVVLKPTWALTRTLKWLDENVVDGLVKLVGQLNKGLGALSAWFDKVFIDGAVNAIALASQVFGAAFRLVQTGRIQQYAAFAMGGAVLTAAWLILA
jgi:NADH-quinone oxidoreductase subunit L